MDDARQDNSDRIPPWRSAASISLQAPLLLILVAVILLLGSLLASTPKAGRIHPS